MVLLLAACSTVPEIPGTKYDKAIREQLYRLDSWSFDGRLALTGKNDSWSANIVWQHVPGKEQIKLSGPLGQGATVIELTEGLVTIDRGNGDVQRSNDPEAFINQQLGMFVPIKSLRYWVVGLPQPAQSSQDIDNGFVQSGWQVQYLQMQTVEQQVLSRKIQVMNKQIKLKLFIDEWVLGSANTR